MSGRMHHQHLQCGQPNRPCTQSDLLCTPRTHRRTRRKTIHSPSAHYLPLSPHSPLPTRHCLPATTPGRIAGNQQVKRRQARPHHGKPRQHAGAARGSVICSVWKVLTYNNYVISETGTDKIVLVLVGHRRDDPHLLPVDHQAEQAL
jgi:hypothetical protein